MNKRKVIISSVGLCLFIALGSAAIEFSFAQAQGVPARKIDEYQVRTLRSEDEQMRIWSAFDDLKKEREDAGSAPLRDLTMIADGEVMKLGVMETASQQTNMDLRLETLQLSIPYESFLKIANGKKTEAKLGSTKFALTDNNLNFMRQFAGKFKA